MSEWDEFYEEDLKDESYEPLHFQICKDKDCKFCKELRKRARMGSEQRGKNKN